MNETFPTINGTEKQVAWANDLRNKAIRDFDEYREEMKRQGKKDNAGCDVYRAWLANHTEAKWWIDNRFEISIGVTALMRKERDNFKTECNF